MKKYLVLEKKEIVNISEPLVESYVNDELWNKNPKPIILSRLFRSGIPGFPGHW